MKYKNVLENEFIQPCYVCGKVWQRKDAGKWCFFANILACKEHPGVMDWYLGAIKMSEEKYRQRHCSNGLDLIGVSNEV